MASVEWAYAMGKIVNRFLNKARSFLRSERGNVAMMFGIALVPMVIAAGVGVDYARSSLQHQQMADALDAAALAVGSSTGLDHDSAEKLAQQYFAANYTGDKSNGAPTVAVAPTGYNASGSVTVTATYNLPTTLLKAIGQSTMLVSASSTVVWGQSKLWVGLVLDNTGSMCEPDGSPCTADTNPNIKINALKTASHGLLSTLQNASAKPGDVMVAIVPFAKDVKVGTAYVGAAWIDWTDWASAPPSGTPSSSVGPGSACPWTSSTYNNCLSQPGGVMASNGFTMTTVSTIPSSGTYAGYICPGSVRSSSSGLTGHYYSGCWNSVPTQSLNSIQKVTQPMKYTQSCTQVGSGTISCGTASSPQTNGSSSTANSSNTTSGYSGDSTSTSTQNNQNTSTNDGSKSCSTKKGVTTCSWTRTTTYNNITTTTVVTGVGPYNHTWIVNPHSTWRGCVMDRDQPADANNTTPGTKFPAENSDACPVAPVTLMSSPAPASTSDMTSMFANLNTQIDAMVANGGTNQTIGLAHGMQMLTSGNPYNAPALPSDTSRYIILLSDGLNTEDRWYGNGSSQSTAIDNRMSAACTNAKAQGFVIYTIFVNLGSSGNSSVLQGCASDSSKYFQLTTSGAIITAFNQIAQQITAVRVSR